MYIITNGTLVTPEALLTHHALVIENDTIQAILPNKKISEIPFGTRIIDARGGWIMPGFIDIHSDYIETIASPRPTSLMDFELSLYEAERELLIHGITTMYHSLSLLGQEVFGEKQIRLSENVIKLLELISDSNQKEHLIHHRMHLRYEIDNFHQYELVKFLIESGKVHLLSFMDHTPGQGQYRDLETYRLVVAGYHDGPVASAEELYQEGIAKEKLSMQDLRVLAQTAANHEIPLASHDDDTVEKLSVVRELGSCISEFPITKEVARAAVEQGLYTVGGAPNVLLGRSHSGNLSVLEAIQDDSISVLCSDYYPPSMLHAVFKLWREGHLSLVDAVRLVTLHPAEAVAIDDTTGSLTCGKTADVIIVNYAGNQVPVVTHTFAKGVLINETTYRN